MTWPPPGPEAGSAGAGPQDERAEDERQSLHREEDARHCRRLRHLPLSLEEDLGRCRHHPSLMDTQCPIDMAICADSPGLILVLAQYISVFFILS